MKTNSNPKIIQGGMGFAISTWRLARAVSMLGQRGTVSGVALEIVLAEGLRKGDPGGHFRRALSHFPFPKVAEKVLKAFYVEGGVGEGRHAPVWSVTPSEILIALTVCANYACVWLAKEGHDNEVAVNYLEKIAMPHLCAITGAMLAGVDAVTMGAGLPFQIPDVLDGLAVGRAVYYDVPVSGLNIKSYRMSFDPAAFFGEKLPELKRPDFYPIISTDLAAKVINKKIPRRFKGFVVETEIAGGHNAPPRRPVLNDCGKLLPIYGPEDVVDYEKLAQIGVPFWIGGGCASPEQLKWALSVGAEGIQVGTMFAFFFFSGLRPDLKSKARQFGYKGKWKVRTDMRASPTGYPFKIAELEGSISDSVVYEARERVCQYGVLDSLYEKPDGTIGYRCPSEPVEKFVAKGGKAEDTEGRICVCCGLCATAGLNEKERPLVTSGDDVSFLQKLMTDPMSTYTAEDAVRYLLSEV